MTRVTRRTRSYFVIAGAATLLGLGVTAGWEVARAQHVHSHAPAAEKGWLVRLAPDARTPAIERQLRGFETTMAEVAYRYTEMYWGGIDGNWEYAAHMHEELGTALELGLERRPVYRKSAEQLFLKGAFVQMGDAIQKKDAALFKERIETLRATCSACHAAEKHAFIKIAVPTVRHNPIEKP